jgi:5-methylthioadenosine/S-adenosylhomocysteine deaminase
MEAATTSQIPMEQLPKKESIRISGGTLVTMDAADSIIRGDLLVKNGYIAAIGEVDEKAATEIDASDCVVLPGFVQTHIHLCQTLFRGAADDLSLIDWLKKRVWLMEAAHSPQSISASARLGIAEMIKGGTTCALTMETVNHTSEVFRVVQESGFRATVGKCMMDKGDEVPSGLREQTKESIQESMVLLERWHGKDDGRLRYCFAPRFAISCTHQLLEEVGKLARERGVMIHTHASENRTECEIVESETGKRNVLYLDSVGLTGKHVVLAHCVHLSDEEIETLARTQTNVSHCPSSNLKLGSGIAPVAKLLENQVSVSLGADGAACNNRLDMFTEMRTAALLQKALHGPEVIPAKRALRMATIDGAKALGLEQEIGSLEIGKKADLMLLKLGETHTTPKPQDLISAIVYSAEASDVQTVVVDGRVLMKDRSLQTLNEATLIREADVEMASLLKRVELK